MSESEYKQAINCYACTYKEDMLFIDVRPLPHFVKSKNSFHPNAE